MARDSSRASSRGASRAQSPRESSRASDRSSPRSQRNSQLAPAGSSRPRRRSSVSILDGRAMPSDSAPRPKVRWAKGVEFLEHDCSVVIKTVNGKRVSKHPLLQGREPPKPRPAILFTTGQKVELYNSETKKWTIARIRGKVRRSDGWHYALRANHQDLKEHVPQRLLRPLKEYDIANDQHLIRHMGWNGFKELMDIPKRGLFRENKNLKALLKHESCPFDDCNGSGESEDWENSMSFQQARVDNPKSVNRVRRASRAKKGNSTGKVICLVVTLIILFAGVILGLIHFEILVIDSDLLGGEARSDSSVARSASPTVQRRLLSPRPRPSLSPVIARLDQEIRESIARSWKRE